MTELIALLAQLDGLNPLNSTAPGRTNGLVFKDLLVIVATGLALGLFLLLWARHYVKSKQRQQRVSRKAVSHSLPAVPDEDNGEEPQHNSRRRRKRRRDHRPRNPTLAETGGLPTTKTETTSNPPL